MITIANSILFFAFYTLYYTSKRVPLTYNLGFEKWLQRNPNSTKIIGISLLVTSYLLWVFITAFGVGTLLFVIALMTIGSLIVILKPLQIIPLKTILLLFIIIEFLEIYYS
ncbi:hypothetical protein [Flavobacterium sp. WC2509]|uniref:hypothetical protein n=1 Tax=Flavobacterium sp. WC2509 TaxID=3461406 RepID=UPI004043FAE9